MVSPLLICSLLPVTKSHTRSEFLSEVVAQSEVNKMGLENIATVFGPNFLTPKEVCMGVSWPAALSFMRQSDNVEALIQSTALVHKLTCTLISEQKRAFEVMPAGRQIALKHGYSI